MCDTIDAAIGGGLFRAPPREAEPGLNGPVGRVVRVLRPQNPLSTRGLPKAIRDAGRN